LYGRYRKAHGITGNKLMPCEADDPDAMIKADGTFVKLKPQYRRRRSGLAGQKIEKSKAQAPAELLCGIGNCGGDKLLKTAVKLECCGRVFNDECIRTRLMENEFVCPYCKTEVELDDIVPDGEMRRKVKASAHEGAVQ